MEYTDICSKFPFLIWYNALLWNNYCIPSIFFHRLFDHSLIREGYLNLYGEVKSPDCYLDTVTTWREQYASINRFCFIPFKQQRQQQKNIYKISMYYMYCWSTPFICTWLFCIPNNLGVECYKSAEICLHTKRTRSEKNMIAKSA